MMKIQRTMMRTNQHTLKWNISTICLLKKVIGDMDCYLVETDGKHHFVTKRFDMEPNGKRYHVHSLAGLLHLDYNLPRTIGYEDLLRTVFRKTRGIRKS